MKTASVILLFLLPFISHVQSQSLDSLINEAIDQNLELKILEKEYFVAKERAPQVSQLPDPEAGIGVFPLPVQTRLGAQILRLSGTQMFPWFGTLESRKNFELAKADALYERIGARALELRYQVEQAYFNLYEIEQSRGIIEDNMVLLNGLEQIALAKLESGQASAADVLRVQLKKEELLQELDILKTMEDKPKAVLHDLLSRSYNADIAVVDSFEFAFVDWQIDSLLEQIAADHPSFRMYELQKEISRKALELNELTRKPSFGAGLDYIMIDGRNDADPSGNGRDIVQLRAAISIPLNRTKYEAKEREEALKVETIEDRKASLLNSFRATIRQAMADYEAAQIRINLYEKQKEIILATINILETNYSTKGNRFDELLRLQQDLIDYELKTLKAIMQSHRAKSKIEKFIIK